MTAPTTIPAPPRKPKARPLRSEGNDDRLRHATAFGSDDGKCHWLISRARTLCGQTRNPPLERHQMHKAAPCPNGNPACPDCVRIAKGRGIA